MIRLSVDCEMPVCAASCRCDFPAACRASAIVGPALIVVTPIHPLNHSLSGDSIIVTVGHLVHSRVWISGTQPGHRLGGGEPAAAYVRTGRERPSSTAMTKAAAIIAPMRIVTPAQPPSSHAAGARLPLIEEPP